MTGSFGYPSEPSTWISSSTAGCWTRTDLEVALSHTMVNFLDLYPNNIWINNGIWIDNGMYQFIFQLEEVCFSSWHDK